MAVNSQEIYKRAFNRKLPSEQLLKDIIQAVYLIKKILGKLTRSSFKKILKQWFTLKFPSVSSCLDVTIVVNFINKIWFKFTQSICKLDHFSALGEEVNVNETVQLKGNNQNNYKIYL